MKSIIEDLIDKLTSQKTKLKIYQDYYLGKHRILYDYPKNTGKRSNTIEVHNFCKLFIDNNTGYLLGNPINLKYREDLEIGEVSLTDLYTDMLGQEIQQTDQKLMQYQQVFGYTYELNYINNDAEFKVDIISPLELSVIRDGNKVIYGLLEREVTPDYTDYDLFDVLNNKIFPIRVVGESIQTASPVHNPISNPIIVVSNNWEKDSEMKDILSLNDSYNTVSSDLSNEISDSRNSYMVIEGADIDEDTLDKINRTGIISVPQGAKVTFPTKDINDNFVQNKLDQLKEQIYNIAGQVDFNDSSVGSNTSSLALRNKLTNLDNKLSLKEGFIKEAIGIRLDNFANYIKGITKRYEEDNLDPTQVVIVINKNIPTSNLEVAEMVTKLTESGILSKETAISQLGFIDDAREELRKLDNESLEDNSLEVDRHLAYILGEDEDDELE